MRRYISVFIVLVVSLILSDISSIAQDDDVCPTLAEQALALADEVCSDMERSAACYGNIFALAEPRPGAEITFEVPGDLAMLADISRLQTGPLDIEAGEWGIAVMTIQVDIPDLSPGQAVTFLLLGATVVTDTSEEEDGMRSMQAFHFSTGLSVPQCETTPNNLVIQNPEGTRVTLKMNGVEISPGSTIVLSANPGELVDVLIVAGEGEVTAAETTETVPAGQMTTIALGGDDGLTPTSAPTPPAAFPLERIQGVPFELLPEEIFTTMFMGDDEEECWFFDAPPPVEGQLMRIVSGIGAWSTFEEAKAALVGISTPVLSVDDIGVGGVKYIGIELVTKNGKQWYGDNAFTYWVATPGTHTFTADWSNVYPNFPENWGGDDKIVTCTFNVLEREDETSP